MSRFEIRNKTVAITGSTSGIGLACAKKFAREGARLVLMGRDMTKLLSAVDEVRASAPSASVQVFEADLLNVARLKDLALDIQKKAGSVDVLINNAAYAVAGLVEDCPVEKFRENFEVNFFAPLRLIQEFIPGMKKKGSGQIINISSGVGKRALPGFSSYSATKFALNGLTESLRLELEPFGIDVISISPGRVSSNFHHSVQFYGRWKMQIPELSIRSPEKIADIIFRASALRRREVVVWGPGRLGYHLNYWFPRLVDKILAKKYPVEV